MGYEHPSRESIKTILQNASTIAVVGLSGSPERTSYMVAQAMQAKGYRIVPVNPNVETVLGEQSYATLRDIPFKIDVVNVFRRSQHAVHIAKQAVEIGAGTLWLQLGVLSEKAAELAAEGGLQVVMDRCIKVEDAILLTEGKPKL
ncbi:CoA-binding protein [Paenibacillus sp. IB182496]|uniref:CoA-binding protein n=1 Tax=Paenibacillus sabuli TaxID=2772509 RepID=A0A927GS10_9BACL|nr:CoA-binding protein [Paenibacillus sabuli]MBD2846224.1 CoA-binding protein [Paenibacillus sabuli]